MFSSSALRTTADAMATSWTLTPTDLNMVTSPAFRISLTASGRAVQVVPFADSVRWTSSPTSTRSVGRDLAVISSPASICGGCLQY